MEKNMVITTTTWYADAQCVRARCAIKTVQNARAHRIPIVVVEGGSPKEFRQELQDYGAIVVDEVVHARGVMGPGRRQAIAKGFEITGGRHSCYFEPEKDCMTQYVEMLFQDILDGKVDLCVPRRRSLKTYPTAQQLADPLGNLHFKQLTGLDLDMWFGPRFFNAAAGKYFLEFTYI